jgi:hypothetical protein
VHFPNPSPDARLVQGPRVARPRHLYCLQERRNLKVNRAGMRWRDAERELVGAVSATYQSVTWTPNVGVGSAQLGSVRVQGGSL